MEVGLVSGGDLPTTYFKRNSLLIPPHMTGKLRNLTIDKELALAQVKGIIANARRLNREWPGVDAEPEIRLLNKKLTSVIRKGYNRRKKRILGRTARSMQEKEILNNDATS